MKGGRSPALSGGRHQLRMINAGRRGESCRDSSDGLNRPASSAPVAIIKWHLERIIARQRERKEREREREREKRETWIRNQLDHLAIKAKESENNSSGGGMATCWNRLKAASRWTHAAAFPNPKADATRELNERTEEEEEKEERRRGNRWRKTIHQHFAGRDVGRKFHRKRH